MAPVVRALALSPRLDQRLVLTGQHAGLAGMFVPVEAEELRFDPAGRSAVKLREALHRLLCRRFTREPADMVVVHGDTASALAGAMAARDCGIPVAHVEAGLRSGDLRQPWPEEGNRMVIDALSDLLFAPTGAALRNLEADWRVKGRILLTGNTGIDALLAAARGLPREAAAAEGGRRLLLVTCHRTENRGEPLRRIAAALKRLVDMLPLEVALPLHPNRHVRGEVEGLLAGTPHISLLEPLEFGEMVRLMARAWIILTDSGGLQEEGPALGRPVLVLRNTTERPEGLESGSIALVGTGEEAVVAAVSGLFHDPALYAAMARPAFPFGDGRAAPRIVAGIESWFAERGRRRAA